MTVEGARLRCAVFSALMQYCMKGAANEAVDSNRADDMRE